MTIHSNLNRRKKSKEKAIFFTYFLKLFPLSLLQDSSKKDGRHPGQAKRDQESKIFKQFWIPAPDPDPIRGSPD